MKENLTKLLWRIRFTLATAWIFRKHKGLHFALGWKASGKTQYTNLKPWDAALEEIGDWYSL